MDQIDSRSVDLILCDLPYGTTRNRWDTIIPFAPLWSHYRRIIKPRGAIVLTATQPFASSLILSNPKWFRYEWVWRKGRATGQLNARYQPLRNHEHILVFCSGRTTYRPQGLVPYGKMNQQGSLTSNYNRHAREPYLQQWTNWPRTVLDFPCAHKPIHPTQKPVALMEYLIRTYTDEGQTVLDNAMGSGTTGVAAVNTGRDFVGIELDANYFAIAQRRIAEAQESHRTGSILDHIWRDI